MNDVAVPRPRRARKASAITTPDPVEIAMEAHASGKPPRGIAEALLHDQRLLIQADLKHRGWQIVSERAGFALKVLTALAGVAAAALIAALAWDASRANGLVVEAFLVPADLAAKGLTGEVAARTVLDRLSQIDAEAASMDAVRISDAWSQGIKIQVPQTGLSLDEIQRVLRRSLGHETYISGEVVETLPGQVQVKVRTGAGHVVTAEGPADSVSRLADQAAERLFAQARPAVYAEVLIRRGDLEAAQPLLAALEQTTTDPNERAKGYFLQGVIAERGQKSAEALGFYQRAALAPDPVRAAQALAASRDPANALGHVEEAVRYGKAAVTRLDGAKGPVAGWRRLQYRSTALADAGDFRGAAAARKALIGVRLPSRFALNSMEQSYAGFLAAQHRISEARRIAPGGGAVLSFAEDWPALLRLLETLPTDHEPPGIAARRAKVLTELGRLSEARAIVWGLPSDCVQCEIGRGLILSREGDVAGSERYFASAMRQGPSWHQGRVLWGRERLARDDVDGAIEVFREGHARAPKWADPIAWWGEALLAKGDAAGAAAKFKAANRLAPRWGRLHLNWGLALAKLGKRDAALAQWRAAAGMDLSAGERARLQQLSSGKGT